MWWFLTAQRWFLWKLVKSHLKILWLFFPWLCPRLPTPLVSLSWKKASSHTSFIRKKIEVMWVRYLKFLAMIRRECRVRKKNSKCGREKEQPNNTHLISKKNCLHTFTQMLRYGKLDVKFIQEFKSIGSFSPVEKCVTIAAACNRY